MKKSSVERLVLLGYRFVTKSKGRFYLYLAVFCTILVLLDAGMFHLSKGLKNRTFDIIMRSRITYQKADPKIVLVDMDEASLAAMAKEYGRWPWPRQVFAEFLENLEAQQPTAVVFDILFSDPDVTNPDSDAYFNDVIAGTDNTFFPMLRLNPKNDELSQVTPKMLPGMGKIPGEKQEDKGMAVILPHFSAALESGRLATNNIYPDKDGIVRQYSVYRDHHGWRIPSLPTRVGEILGWELPPDPDFIINWRGKLGAFTTARFSDVYNDFLSSERKRPQDEFTNKIVIIGSTAPALFDMKPTPMEMVHPGVEILASAIGNIKNGDWITQITNPWFFAAVALSFIWLTALGFLTGVKRNLIDGLFAGSQAVLIGVSFASLNLSTYYIDLTAPIAIGFVYFSLARVYAYAEVTLTERRVWLSKEEGVEGWQYSVVAVLHLEKESSEGKVVMALKRRLNEAKEGFTVEPFPHKPAGIGKAYGDLMLIYHVESEVAKGDWKADDRGNKTVSLIEEVAQDVFEKQQSDCQIGICQGAMPYGDEEARVKAWRRLVTYAIVNFFEKTEAP